MWKREGLPPEMANEAPSSKFQISNNMKIPLPKIPNGALHLCFEHWVLGVWNLFGAWDFGFGAC
jgi:hypothetical protein